jgi:hypothetical protein
MTQRLYYHDSFLYDFDAEVRSVLETPRPALILDRTAFYPTSGGQIHDTGWIASENSDTKLRVTEVADTEDGKIVHYLEAPVKDVQPGTPVHGEIDANRRRDHMQQHSAPARAFRGLCPPVQYAHRFLPHGRRLLLHRSRYAFAHPRSNRIRRTPGQRNHLGKSSR